MREPPLTEVDFGYKRVPLQQQQRLVDRVFHTVARRYDLMNDLMSGGLHRAWKDALVTLLNPPRNAVPFALVDIAGGTGDVAFRIVEAGGSGTRATVLDVNDAMLKVGRTRAIERGLHAAVWFLRANAESLPLAGQSCDAVSIAFGVRNVPNIPAMLAETRRVLKIGGQFGCLEFSACDVPGLDALYDLYALHAIPAIGRAVVGDAEPYRYLFESIRRFPRPEAFAAMMRNAGLRQVSYRLISGGIVALYSGWRL